MLEVLSPATRTRARNRRLAQHAICALALLVACGRAHTQTKPTPASPAKTAEVKTAPRGARATRTRRVAAQAKAAPKPKPSAAPAAAATPATVNPEPVAPAVRATEEHAVAKPTAAATPVDDAQPAAPVDTLAALRAEISATTVDSERGRLQRELINRLVGAADKAAALNELSLLLHEDRYDPPFFYNLGNALARLGDTSAATDAYRKAISQRRGHYARALNNLGVLLTRQGHWEEAQDALVGALNEEHDAYPEASYNLGRLYLLRGETDLAIREWRRTLARQPDHADAAAALARAYAKDGDAQRGLAVLDAYTARSTRTGDGVPLPVAYARREIVAADVAMKEDGARQSAGNNVVINSTRPAAGLRPLAVSPQVYNLLQRARTAREAGRYADAVKYYRDVLASSNGYFPPANLEMAFSLANLKRNDEALAALEALVAKDDARYPVAYYHLGRLYEQTSQLDRAADSFARAAALYGDTNPQVLVDLSRVRGKLNDNAGALAAMEAYAKAVAQQGTLPAWAAERLTQLRAKNAAPVAKQ